MAPTCLKSASFAHLSEEGRWQIREHWVVALEAAANADVARCMDQPRGEEEREFYHGKGPTSSTVPSPKYSRRPKDKELP